MESAAMFNVLVILCACVLSVLATFTDVKVSIVTNSKGTKITKTITTDAKQTIYQPCHDHHELCSYWALTGECDSSPEYMTDNCKRSCGGCGAVPCEDREDECKYWASTGECQKNTLYMLKNCRVSCGACNPGCRDQHKYCRDWSVKGECAKNPGYMHKKCPWSCWVC